MLDGVIFGYLLPEIPPKYIMPRPYHTIYELDLEIGKWQKEFEKLQLTESEVGQLLYQFERIDLDDSGGISYGEFVKFLRLNNNEFAGRAFGMCRYVETIYDVRSSCCLRESGPIIIL